MADNDPKLRLVDPDGQEYQAGSMIEFHNLRAQGYAPVAESGATKTPVGRSAPTQPAATGSPATP